MYRYMRRRNAEIVFECLIKGHIVQNFKAAY